MREPFIVQLFPSLADDPAWMIAASLAVIAGSFVLALALSHQPKAKAARSRRGRSA